MLPRCLALILTGLSACSPSRDGRGRGEGLQVVTTLFPLYDFARNVGGEKAAVTLLLPPGVEPHSFEPRPKDILRINQADIFIYTGRFMEPWAASHHQGRRRKQLVVVDASEGVTLEPETEAAPAEVGEPRHDKGKEGATKSLSTPISGWTLATRRKWWTTSARDSSGKIRVIRRSTRRMRRRTIARLAVLDRRFRDGLAECKTRPFRSRRPLCLQLSCTAIPFDVRVGLRLLSGCRAQPEAPRRDGRNDQATRREIRLL